MLQNERGAISLIFALLFSSLVIVALFALVVDVGTIYQERRTLQNAADATALAVAQDCAEFSAGTSSQLCQSQNLDLASSIASKNTDDGKTLVIEVCGLGFSGVSSSSLISIGSGSKYFEVPSSGSFSLGQRVRIVTSVNSANFMEGEITALSATNITVFVNLTGGLGSFEKWEFSLPLEKCPPSTNSQHDCIADDLEQFIRIRTESADSANQGGKNFFFASFLDSSNDRFELRACSQAAWGAASQAPVVYPLALPICSYADSNTVQHNRFDASYPYYLPGELCTYKPIGGREISIDTSEKDIVKGMVLFDYVNDNSIGCPTKEDPVAIKIGDKLTQINGVGGSLTISQICEPALSSLGFEGSRDEKYEQYLRQYILGETLYIPVVQEFTEGKLIVAGFFSVIPLGIRLKTSISVGFGQSGPDFSTGGWITSPASRADCPSSTYCFFGKFTRATPPGLPRKTDPSQPNLGSSKISLER